MKAKTVTKTTKVTKESKGAMSSAVAAAASAAASAEKPGAVTLTLLRKKLAEARDIELELQGLAEVANVLSKRLSKLRTEELPGMFEAAGLTSLSLDASGNMPACDAELTVFYSASLPKDETKRAAAFKKFKWLHELRKHKFTLTFAKGEDKKAKTLAATLKKQKLKFEDKVDVHSGSLTAEIRRRFEDGTPLPPADLELLGAMVGTVVKLTLEQKD